MSDNQQFVLHLLQSRHEPLTLERQAHALIAHANTVSILNLRGNAEDDVFKTAVEEALELALPTKPCTLSRQTCSTTERLIIWAGPSDWFIIDTVAPPKELEQKLKKQLNQNPMHFALTDVSSGYRIARLTDHTHGHVAREVLAQGCPLDLHTSVFDTSHCAASHFYKCAIYLWQNSKEDGFGVMFRSSFAEYFWLSIVEATREYGLVVGTFD